MERILYMKVISRLDSEQSLFYSKFRGEERKKQRNTSLSGREQAERDVQRHVTPAVTLSHSLDLPVFLTDFRANDRLFAVYSKVRRPRHFCAHF